MRVVAVCAGLAGDLAVHRGNTVEHVASAIAKTAASTLEDPRSVEVRHLGVSGDEQADPAVHGGPAKAVYAYPAEHYPFWETVRGQAGFPGRLPFGWLGENLSIEGLTEANAWIGDRLRLGEAELRIESPRRPCFKLDARMGFGWASRMMIQSGFTGFYCSVLREGRVRAGDAIEVVAGDRIVSVGEMHRLRSKPPRRTSN